MKKYTFSFCEETNTVTIGDKNGNRILSCPASAQILTDGREVTGIRKSVTETENSLTIRFDGNDEAIGEITLTFQLGNENMTVSLAAEAKEDLRVQEAEYFRSGRHGMYMVDCYRYFAPAPRNYNGINRAFFRNFPDCGLDSYFAPPPLYFCIGNRFGLVSFGLLDLPDSFSFRLSPRLGISAEMPGGKIVTEKGSVYKAPRLVLTFPETEWESMTAFRAGLEAHGVLPATKGDRPTWWNRPTVVTYGDEMMELQYNWYTDEDLDGNGFCEEWLDMWLARAEEQLGNTDFTIIIDAYWQARFSAAPIPSARFKNLRGFIDMCHEKGHKVLLWTAPLFDNPETEMLSEKYGVLSVDTVENEMLKGFRFIDFTSEKAEEYLAELARRFFSADADALNADGLKMDSLSVMRDPMHDVHYEKPENGIGIREMFRFYKLFSAAAKKVKSDVLINGSTCEPRFAPYLDANRLHDIQYVWEEREMRAAVSAGACPDLLIDSDGAIMISDWVEATYVRAVIYASPSLYYVGKFHDSVCFPKDKMRALGRLLALSEKKMNGVPRRTEKGDWQLWSDGKITASSFGNDGVYVFDGKGTLYVFAWRDGTYEIDVPDIRADVIWGGKLKINLRSGEVKKIKASL